MRNTGPPVLYCARCDFAFCVEHRDQHDDAPGHELKPDDRVDFCAVCSDIYAPRPVTTS